LLGTVPPIEFQTYADSDKELVEVDVAVVVGVEEAHEGVGLLTSDSDLDLTETGVELFSIDLLVSIEGVEVSESSSETSDGLGSPGVDLVSHSLENYKPTSKTGG